MTLAMPTRHSTPRLRLGVACDSAHIGYDGKLHIGGIFDRIAVPHLPARRLHFCVAAMVACEPGHHTVLLELRDPDGHSAMRDGDEDGIEVPLDVIDAHGTLVAEFTNLPVERDGRYTIALSVAGECVGTVPVEVEVWPARTASIVHRLVPTGAHPWLHALVCRPPPTMRRR